MPFKKSHETALPALRSFKKSSHPHPVKTRDRKQQILQLLQPLSRPKPEKVEEPRVSESRPSDTACKRLKSPGSAVIQSPSRKGFDLRLCESTCEQLQFKTLFWDEQTIKELNDLNMIREFEMSSSSEISKPAAARYDGEQSKGSTADQFMVNRQRLAEQVVQEVSEGIKLQPPPNMVQFASRLIITQTAHNRNDSVVHCPNDGPADDDMLGYQLVARGTTVEPQNDWMDLFVGMIEK